MEELKEYQDFFIVANEWGHFDYTDLRPNDVRNISGVAPVPNFVRNFEQDLERRPNVASHVRYWVCSVCSSILTVCAGAPRVHFDG